MPASERYAPPRLAEPYPPYPSEPALPSREIDYDEAPPRPSYPSGPALPPREIDYEEAPPRASRARGDARDRAADDPRYRDDDPQLPAFLPRAPNTRYQDDDAARGAADDQDYALEDYDEEAASPRRRGGFVVVAAVLGLAVLGTAGAFAYRAMFGGSMLPSLPPIIKAEDGPTKIMPSYGETHRPAANQAASPNSGSGEKLVSREEKP